MKKYTAPWSTSLIVLSSFVTVICVGIAIFSGLKPVSAIVALPVAFAAEIMLVLWVSFLLASLYIHVRDLAHVYQVFLRLLFFITPIFYGLSFVGEGTAKYLLLANPLTHSITFVRTLILKGQLFDVKTFLVFISNNESQNQSIKIVAVVFYFLNSFVLAFNIVFARDNSE